MPDPYSLEIWFADKQINSSSLQIADLVAHPIARNAIKQNQPNKAFDIVKEKLLGYPKYEEIGIRRLPLESEKPRQEPRLNSADVKAPGVVMTQPKHQKLLLRTTNLLK